jgi:hypothetical protein
VTKKAAVEADASAETAAPAVAATKPKRATRKTAPASEEVAS